MGLVGDIVLIEITITDVSEDISAHGQFLATHNGECAVYQLQYIKKWSEKVKANLNKSIKVEA